MQVARTVRAGIYRRDVASPGASPFPIADGEASILEQYLAAVDAAERTIYLENQILLCPVLVPRLDAALARGVDVIAVVPAKAMPELIRYRQHPQAMPLFAMIEELARHDNFTMAALGATREDGSHDEIYVHAKVAMVDDEWATIGSANAMLRSFGADTEMNVTAWDQAVARGLRTELFAEHFGDADGAAASGRNGTDDDRVALGLLRERALGNSQRRREGRPMRGNIFAIDPRQWAVPES